MDKIIPEPTGPDEPGDVDPPANSDVFFQRDYIADRTGDLMREAHAIASKHLRMDQTIVFDPRDGTPMPAFLGHGAVQYLAPESFDCWRHQPIYRKGVAKLTTIQSFIDLTNRFKAPNSAIFANDDMQGSPGLTTIFDYHPVGPELFDEASDITAMAMRHRALYQFPLSDPWKAWNDASGREMPMVDFARFIEDRIIDVSSEPLEKLGPATRAIVEASNARLGSASRLMEISRGLQVNESSNVREVRNLSTGEAQVSFVTEHQGADGKPLLLPNMFAITIPVFAGEKDVYVILARFRYRKRESSLRFWFELVRPDITFDTAFKEACEAVAITTGLPIFVGMPEGN